MLKIPGDKFIDFFFTNNKIELPDIKKSIICKIHNWTQYFIHGGYVLNLWQIDIAHSLLRPLFIIGEKNGNLSINGSIKISEEYFNTQYKTDLEKYIQDNFFEERNENNTFKIIYMTPEALIY